METWIIILICVLFAFIVTGLVVLFSLKGWKREMYDNDIIVESEDDNFN